MGATHFNHCVYDTHYHIVFPVKYRKALLGPHIDKAILEIAKEIEERYDITCEKIGTDDNHIHLLCSFHTKYSGGQVVGMFKSITARELFRGDFLNCGRSSGAVSSGATATISPPCQKREIGKRIERYVANQGKTMQKPGQLTLWN